MNDAFNGTSRRIPLQEAVDMTDRFRAQREKILEASVRAKAVLPIAETFGRQDVEDLLNQYDCEGLRIYWAMDKDRKLHALLVGVGPEGNDLVPETSLEDEYFLLKGGLRSPAEELPPSPLNS